MTIQKRFIYCCQLYWKQIALAITLLVSICIVSFGYVFADFVIYEGADAYTHGDHLLSLVYLMLDDIVGSTSQNIDKAINLQITSSDVLICGITIQGAGSLINILNQNLQNIAVTICSKSI